MFKRILTFVFLISFLSVGFCFAFDANSAKGSLTDIWNNCFPKIVEYWNIAVNWVNNDMKPWIERNIGTKARQEFEREFSEALVEVPATIKGVWNDIIEMFN